MLWRANRVAVCIRGGVIPCWIRYPTTTGRGIYCASATSTGLLHRVRREGSCIGAERFPGGAFESVLVPYPGAPSRGMKAAKAPRNVTQAVTVGQVGRVGRLESGNITQVDDPSMMGRFSYDADTKGVGVPLVPPNRSKRSGNGGPAKCRDANEGGTVAPRADASHQEDEGIGDKMAAENPTTDGDPLVYSRVPACRRKGHKQKPRRSKVSVLAKDGIVEPPAKPCSANQMESAEEPPRSSELAPKTPTKRPRRAKAVEDLLTDEPYGKPPVQAADIQGAPERTSSARPTRGAKKVREVADGVVETLLVTAASPPEAISTWGRRSMSKRPLSRKAIDAEGPVVPGEVTGPETPSRRRCSRPVASAVPVCSKESTEEEDAIVKSGKTRRRKSTQAASGSDSLTEGKAAKPKRITKKMISDEVLAQAHAGVFGDLVNLQSTYKHVLAYVNPQNGQTSDVILVKEQQSSVKHRSNIDANDSIAREPLPMNLAGVRSISETFLHKPAAMWVIPQPELSPLPVHHQTEVTIPRLGYACLNMTLRQYDIFTSRDCIKRVFEERGLAYISQLALANAKDLVPLLEWNEHHGIRFFRLSSCIFPWMSFYNMEDLPDWAAIQQALKAAGDLAKRYGHRLTFHPSEYTKIAGESEGIVETSVKELEVHSKVFDYMGFLPPSPFNKINIHVGGVYGDKTATLQRFAKVVRDRLSANCRARLTVENDDRASMYNVEDLYELHRMVGIPIVFDFHHHRFCPGTLSEKDAFLLALSTWPPGIRPVVHWSESQEGRLPHAHSDYVVGPIHLYGHEDNVDVMIEAKAKELALLTYRERAVMGPGEGASRYKMDTGGGVGGVSFPDAFA